MKLPLSTPELSGSARAREARRIRRLATEISRLNPQALTRANGEEDDHAPNEKGQGGYPANFTKGLLHNNYGLIKNAVDYRNFVEAINSHDTTLFEKLVRSALDSGGVFHCEILHPCDEEVEAKLPAWRGWESPRSGHVFELQGPDAGATGMAPAPRVGSSELAAEMAEVYLLALLRDVPFTEICAGGNQKLCGKDFETHKALISGDYAAELLNTMRFYSGDSPISSTPHHVDAEGFNRFERNRRNARFKGSATTVSPETLFRGSTKGAMEGPYISQFMLIGSNSLHCPNVEKGMSNFPGENSEFDFRDGFIRYGSLIIDQRTLTHKNCLDYMTSWCPWLDVQNGAKVSGIDLFEGYRRFITTPRDLATYVHYDALYEAYLNAALILLSFDTPRSKGFPEPSPSGRRDSFATFGGPHILSLVTEVATRCLKAVRRQKFNYHRRARPEAMGGRFTLLQVGKGEELGCTEEPFQSMLDEFPEDLVNAILAHNDEQNSADMAGMRKIVCNEGCDLEGLEKVDFENNTLLLPMAFPEGSPMHPAYGAGHATVAGGCVTMLKAFFEMYEDCDGMRERKLAYKDKAKVEHPIRYVPNNTGTNLIKDPKGQDYLTIQGELDKLAANISIGRNMAGVHYYSDYYDSLRLGERIAVGILLEQGPTYGEEVSCTFKTFDGDLLTISCNAGNKPSLSILDENGDQVSPKEWWLRHVVGEEHVEDFPVS